ncbi:MAG: acetoacetyl-CoA reductase [Holosporaceae bacterium]|nr:acetoacetyl-CoA reductase [Holosporaceae bacterium]
MKRTALVTGGTRGIGGGVSMALNDAGYLVAANYQNGVETAEKFQNETGIPTFSWDVSDYQSCEKGILNVCETLGGTIDILVNNAGITRDCMLHRMNPEDWAKVISINLNSVFNMCRLIIPSMRDRQFGRIINISSVNGLKGQVGQSNYSAAKAGILGFTKALALESASKGITVNAVAPGYVSTDMTEAIPHNIKESIKTQIPVGRFGKIEEIANTVLFLADEKSSFITGAVLSVNGGQYL